MSRRAATLRQSVVVADTDEAMLAVRAGRTLFEWQMRELVRFGVTDVLVICPALSPVSEATLRVAAAALPKPVRLAITGHALPDIIAGLDPRLLLWDAAGLFDGNLATLLAASAADPAGHAGRVLVMADGRASGLAAVARETLSTGLSALPSVTAEGRMTDPGANPRTSLAPRPALFLDRDGTLNVDHGYVGTRERFEWIPGARAAVARASGLGWHVFIVTNQSGIGRGLYDEAAVGALHDWMAEEFHRAGGTIDDIRICPFHPDAIRPEYRRASDWRKPAPGMLLDLIRAWELDPRSCILVGDQPSDLGAATAAGVVGHLFGNGNLDAFVSLLLRIPAASALPLCAV